MENNIILRNNRISAIKQSIQLNVPMIRKNHELVKNRLIHSHKTIGDHHQDREDKAIQLSDISLFDQKYQVGDRIGEGSDGVVRLCTHRATGEIYAVKSMMMDEEQIYFLKKNFNAVKKLDHQSIVKYRSLYLDMCKHISYLVMSYVAYPKLVHLPNSSDELVLIPIFYQLFQTLQYLHSNKMCHRDIKPDNILYDSKSNRIKIIDFGISKEMIIRAEKRSLLTLTGTLYYRAPQMFIGGGYDERVDLWAAGITLYKMLTNVTPFQSDYNSDTISNILNGYNQQHQKRLLNNSASVKNLISLLLQPVNTRISAAQALEHDWFSNYKYKNHQQLVYNQIKNLSQSDTIYQGARKLSNNESDSSPLLYFLNEIREFPKDMMDDDQKKEASSAKNPFKKI